MSLFNSSLGFEKIREILNKKDAKIHFVGILGAGMAPLSELVRDRGILVTGTDRAKNSVAERLILSGIPVIFRHTDEMILGADAVVYSLAVPWNCPELSAARRLGIPLISRAELLGAIMTEYAIRIGISGSHGKSTTTAITERIFTLGGLNPTTVSGAELASGEALRRGSRDVFIYEACEYKESFLRTSPTTSVITGAELDHTDFYRSEEHILSAFEKFAKLARDTVIINSDDVGAESLISALGNMAVTYGRGEGADYRYVIKKRGLDGTDFEVYYLGESLGEFKVSVIGDFSVSNATAAIATGHRHGISVDILRQAVREFRGISRRLERIGTLGSRPVLYDYAHHPTEIESTVRAVKDVYGECTVVFRPHTYSRTASLWDGFVKSLGLADFSVLVDIYPAREDSIPGITSSALSRAIGKKSTCLEFDEVYQYVRENTRGAVILMGAGDIEEIKDKFIKR